MIPSVFLLVAEGQLELTHPPQGCGNDGENPENTKKDLHPHDGGRHGIMPELLNEVREVWDLSPGQSTRAPRGCW